MGSLTDRARELLPGIALLSGTALVASLVAGALPVAGAVLPAVLIGALVANAVGVPARAEPGVRLHKLLLETGIVLMGARISLSEVTATGPRLVALVAGTVAVGLALAELLSRAVFGLTDRIGSLIAAGASVCGVSAVVAVAGSIDAEEEHVAYAVATVLLFDAVTLVAFPIAGGLGGVPPKVFGVWAGLSMFSTGPVAAAGFAYSEVAGQWATLTKLVRNSFIGVVAVAYSVYYLRDSESGRTCRSRLSELWDGFPKFLVGFLLVALAANAGAIPAAGIPLLNRASDALFVLAFAGLGFDVRAAAMRRAGLSPVLVALVHLLVMGALTLAAASLLLAP
ncbi:YeiH family protein [Halegenticoccus soli]|uniref:YeiH family protein n=1 Tax=Halegenticoccus soli TaxID=1985678 RepID=UPI000C6EE41F|nr:putative sulfate exporter family transporter [Halegenticoccus soli]